jgi:hypothetical protein
MAATKTPAVVDGATLQCGHGGVITVTTSARLTVNKHGVLLAGSESGLSFQNGSPPCSDTTTDPAPKPAPCTTLAASSGTTTRLTVGKKGIVLGSAGGTTVAVPSNVALPAGLTWTVASPGQGRLNSA